MKEATVSEQKISMTVLQRWEAAQLEVTHAEMNLRKPGFDDYLSELRDRLIRAHQSLSEAYDAILADSSLPDALQAALKAASQLHRERAENVPPV